MIVVYPYFFDMEADGVLILDTLDKIQSIQDFMLNSYSYCQEHETEIRNNNFSQRTVPCVVSHGTVIFNVIFE